MVWIDYVPQLLAAGCFPEADSYPVFADAKRRVRRIVVQSYS